MLLLVRKGRMKAYEDVRRDMKINKGIAVAVAALSIVGLAACGKQQCRVRHNRYESRQRA